MLAEQPTMGDPEMVEGREAPPPGVQIMAAVRWMILGLAVIAAATSCWAYFRATSVAADARMPAFYCPMHAHAISEVEGNCPICHMALEPIPAERKGPSTHPAHEAMSPLLRVPNRVAVTLSPERLAAVGAAAVPVIFGNVPGSGRIKATVARPEDAIPVHPRLKGVVEHIGLRETDVHVQKGQELCAVSSPDLLHAQLELLNLRSSDDTAAIAAAREKVESLGLTNAEVDQVLMTSQPIRMLPVKAPVSGVVKTKNVVQGMQVSPGSILYSIVDASHVYLFADLPAFYLPSIGEGTVTSFFPSATPLFGIGVKVDFIDSMMEAEARSARVRMVALDPRRPLEPGTSGQALFTAPGRRALVLPPAAVIENGVTPYVFVEEGEGRFAPRPVVVGAEIKQEHDSTRLEITGGLEPNERVVVQGTFVVDSESALQASVREGKEP